jgi:hypothetical protein
LGLAPPAGRPGQDGLGGVRVRNSHVSSGPRWKGRARCHAACEPSPPPTSGSTCICGTGGRIRRPGRAKPVSRFPHPRAPARPGPGRRGYHGDLDWGGGRIATALARSVPWRPWR